MGSIVNYNLIKKYLTNNFQIKKDVNGNEYEELTPVQYRWTHGATDKHLGDGMLVYSVIQYMRAKTCVCLGSGGGFIPRIMSQSRMDLHDQEIFEGSQQMEWGDIGTTILVDANNGVGGFTDWTDTESFQRKHFPCRIILDTTKNAYYNYFVKEDIRIDYLHIDAGHSYEDVKQDFELYSKQLSEHGIISIHDTDTSYEKEHIITNDVSEQNHHDEYVNGPSKLIEELKENNDWEIFNFFNNGIFKSRPSSTGLTFVQRCKK
jgi:hypothetical protein